MKPLSPNRPRRQGGRGYWVRRREVQIRGRTKSKFGGGSSPEDSKSSKQNRVNLSEIGAVQNTGEEGGAGSRPLDLPQGLEAAEN